MTGRLQSEFESYVEACEIPTPSPAMIDAMRQTFFAGALAAIYALGDVPERELVRELEHWRAEENEEADLWRRRN